MIRGSGGRLGANREVLDCGVVPCSSFNSWDVSRGQSETALSDLVTGVVVELPNEVEVFHCLSLGFFG